MTSEPNRAIARRWFAWPHERVARLLATATRIGSLNSDDHEPARPSTAREHLERMGIRHGALDQADVFTALYTLHGWYVVPRTSAERGPISARVWLLAALHTHGRYLAPEISGHPAELEDGGEPIDSVILMAIIQRHFLPAHAPGWDDADLAAQLGLEANDIARAQRVLERTESLLRHPRPAPLGGRWWEHAEHAPFG